VKFESKLAEWCTYKNFSEMYDHIYEAMVLHGIASKVDTEVLLNKEGSIVEEPKEAFGLPTQYLLQRPDKLIFVDEVGSNTSTTKDGHIGGEKFLCEANGRPQIKAVTKDSHSMVLGFTSASFLRKQCARVGSWGSMHQQHGLERITTFAASLAALIKDIRKGQFVTSTARQSQPSVPVWRMAASLQNFSLICFASLTASKSSIDPTALHHSSFLMVTAVVLRCHS
jgi:hypothetical protein